LSGVSDHCIRLSIMEPDSKHHTILTEQNVAFLKRSRTILIIKNHVYDVTEFIETHPGGADVILSQNGMDATLEFEKVNHSVAAVKMLSDYCIGRLDAEEMPTIESPLKAESESLFTTLKKKLITTEDYFHLHKCLGFIVLAHIIIRSGFFIYLSVSSFWINHNKALYDTCFFSKKILLIMAFIHGLLSLTSLFFHVPSRSSSAKPTIHRLFRAHSISFALRAVFCMLAYCLLNHYSSLHQLIVSVIVLLTMVLADVLSYKIPQKDDLYTTTAAMPYWYGCSVRRQKIHKYAYGFAQFFATLVCIFGHYSALFFTLVGIQGAAFLMTLTRKNIISEKKYHIIYSFLLFYSIPFYMLIKPLIVISALALTGICYQLRRLNISKYTIWVPIILLSNIRDLPSFSQIHFLEAVLLLAALAGFIQYLFFNTKIDRDRVNNVIIDKKSISANNFELLIKSNKIMNFFPGQHVMIRYNDMLRKQYTPIAWELIPETNQTQLTLRIKQYEDGDTASTSKVLCSSQPGAVLDLHGPYGQRYFSIHQQAIIDERTHQTFYINEVDLILCAAGSGITPIYQLALQSLQSNQNITLVTSDRDIQSRLMHEECACLKRNYGSLLLWKSYLSNESLTCGYSDQGFFRRITQTEVDSFFDSTTKTLIVICGPKKWQDLFITSEKAAQSSNTSLLIW
jgi:NAD(P)H-flavin reductase/cytochrome b involved in lipid metabolism